MPIIVQTEHGVDRIPADSDLVASEERSGNDSGLAVIRDFRRIPDCWDLVFVDTPPALGYLSLAPLVTSHHVVIPVEARALALPGTASVVASTGRARQQPIRSRDRARCRAAPRWHRGPALRLPITR